MSLGGVRLTTRCPQHCEYSRLRPEMNSKSAVPRNLGSWNVADHSEHHRTNLDSPSGLSAVAGLTKCLAPLDVRQSLVFVLVEARPEKGRKEKQVGPQVTPHGTSGLQFDALCHRIMAVVRGAVMVMPGSKPPECSGLDEARSAHAFWVRGSRSRTAPLAAASSLP